MVSLIVILLVLPLILRRYSRRAETGGGDVPDKVHRIRRAHMITILALPVLVFMALVEGYSEGQALVFRHGVQLPAHHGGGGAAVALLVYLVIFAGGAVLSYLAIYPPTARLRGLPSQPGRAGRRQTRFILAALAPQVIWVGIWSATRTLHGTAQWVVLPLWIAYTVAMVVFGPRLMRAMLATRPVDDEVRQRLLRLAREHQVKIRDIRCLDTGPEQTANAMLLGLLPRSRYVLITDRLLHDLEPDELDAVLAHELAHAKKHHLPIKLGAMLATWIPLGALAGVVAALGGHGHASAALKGVLVVLAIVLLMASLIMTQGIVGVRLERSADDYASAATSPDALRRGLEKLATANAAKRRTGRLWNLVNQHPGMDQRIERLRQASTQPEPAAH